MVLHETVPTAFPVLVLGPCVNAFRQREVQHNSTFSVGFLQVKIVGIFKVRNWFKVMKMAVKKKARDLVLGAE